MIIEHLRERFNEYKKAEAALFAANDAFDAACAGAEPENINELEIAADLAYEVYHAAFMSMSAGLQGALDINQATANRMVASERLQAIFG